MADNSDFYLGAIDQGTTSTRFILFNQKGEPVSSHQIELTQHFPAPDMHEQEPYELLTTTLECINQAVRKAGIKKDKVRAVGITNQRETVIAWDKESGEPLYNAIVWDDTRTADICMDLNSDVEIATQVNQKTGLPINPYFSGSKIAWLIRNVPEVEQALHAGNLRVGTVDCWLIHKLTKEQPFVTDISNASRTLLMNLEGSWDPWLCNIWGINVQSLPEIKSSAEVYGHIACGELTGVAVAGCLGDQQAAMVGHRCLEPGKAKNTYGTGSFMLMNIGNKPIPSTAGLLTTVLGKFKPDGEIVYALEAAVEAAGSTIQWAKNNMGLFQNFEELEKLAGSVEDSGNVMVVPAFSGLFAPYWRSDARGTILGITQHTTKAHILRALLEGIALRTSEAVFALKEGSGMEISALSIDGGLTNNDLFVQIQANILGHELEVPEIKDLTALGVALTAGIGIGVFSGLDQINNIPKKIKKVVRCNLGREQRSLIWNMWKDAIPRSLNWG